MTEETKNTITIDGIEYDYDSLSEDAKYYIAQIRDLKSQIESTRAKLDQLNMAHNGFGNMLTDDLSKQKEDSGA